MRRALLWAMMGAGAAAGAGTVACAGSEPDRERVLLVTTTSVEASGLLDEILEAYHASQERYRLSTTAVGSGAALEIGRRGDADVLLTHDPDGERRFIEQGHGAEHGPVMMNEFLLIGPADDPAAIGAAADPADALSRIADAEALFLSRGDDSGTHRKERDLWQSAGLRPWDGADWYTEAGTGMGETLQMAGQLGAYVLTDEASYRFMQGRLGLELLFSGHPSLENRYSFILPARPRNAESGRDFVDWLTGPGQELIADYGVDSFGEALFRPATR